MSECTFCYDFFILDSCVLDTVKTNLKDNPIQCGGCNLNITRDCMYVKHWFSDFETFTE